MCVRVCLQYGTRHIIDTMRLAGQKVELVVVCGGLAKNKLYVQTHADILGSYLYLLFCITCFRFAF